MPLFRRNEFKLSAIGKRAGFANKAVIVSFTDSGGLVLVTTAIAHGKHTGQQVALRGELYSGTYAITVVSPTTYTLDGSTYTADDLAGGSEGEPVTPTVHTTTLTAASGTFTWQYGSVGRSVICIGAGGTGGSAGNGHGGGGGGWSTKATTWDGDETPVAWRVGQTGGGPTATAFGNADECLANFGENGSIGGPGAGGDVGVGDTVYAGGAGGAVNVGVLGGGGGGAAGSTGNGGVGAAGAAGGAGGIAGTGGANSGAGGAGKLVTGDAGANYGGGGGGGVTAGGAAAGGVIVVSQTY